MPLVLAPELLAFFQMHQTSHFFDIGYGWLCKHCCAEDTERKHNHQNPHSSEESTQERNSGKLTNLALAKWIDEERHGLACPRCGIEEHLTRL